MFKANNRGLGKRHWHRFGFLIADFERFSYLFAAVSFADFELVNVIQVGDFIANFEHIQNNNR